MSVAYGSRPIYRSDFLTLPISSQSIGSVISQFCTACHLFVLESREVRKWSRIKKDLFLVIYSVRIHSYSKPAAVLTGLTTSTQVASTPRNMYLHYNGITSLGFPQLLSLFVWSPLLPGQTSSIPQAI